MPRMSTKRFEYGKGVYYFNINKGYNSKITIKRMDKAKAVLAFSGYLRTSRDKCEWLGLWDGKKFTENDWETVKADVAK